MNQAFSTLFGIGMAVVPIVGIILCFPTRTRRWGQGLLLGIPLALGGALVIGAGLCVVLIAGGDF